MRRSRLFAVVAICAVSAGCSSLQTSFNVLTFDEDENSGKATQQFTQLTVLSRFTPQSDDPVRGYNELLATSDAELADVLSSNACRPEAEHAPRGFAPGLITDLAVKAASILYNASFDELAVGAKKLQARATPVPYAIRLASGTRSGGDALRWQDVKCIVLQRRWLPDTETGFDAPVSRPRPITADDKGLTVVLQRLPKGDRSSTLRPIYLRMDNAVAVTGAGSADKPASVQTHIAFKLSEAVASGDKASVNKVAEFTFLPIELPLGRSAQACRINDPVMACEYDSDLIPDPNTNADAIAIAVSVKEIGSAANAEARAKAGIEALKAISKPIFDAFIDEIKTATK